MQDGVYKATFWVGPNAGDGIVTISNNKISGGDYGFTYVGDLIDAGGSLSGHVDVAQWNPDVPNVFTGLTQFRLNFTGAVASPTVAKVSGTTAAAPGSTVHIDLTLLAKI